MNSFYGIRPILPTYDLALLLDAVVSTIGFSRFLIVSGVIGSKCGISDPATCSGLILTSGSSEVGDGGDGEE